MNTQFAHTRTAKLIGVSAAIGSLFLGLTACSPAESKEAAPSATVAASATPTAEAEPSEFPATFLSAIDGDTAKVQRVSEADGSAVGEPISLNILGIDAPEIGQCGGDEAKAEFERIVNPQARIIVTFDAKAPRADKESIAQAYISSGPSDLGERLVSGGFAGAWHAEDEVAPTRFDSYVKAASAAKDQKAGSWATCDTLGR